MIQLMFHTSYLRLLSLHSITSYGTVIELSGFSGIHKKGVGCGLNVLKAKRFSGSLWEAWICSYLILVLFHTV